MYSRFCRKTQREMSVVFQPPYLCPLEGHQHGVSIQSFVNLGKTFPEYLAFNAMKYRTDLIFLLDFLHTGYLSSFISQILHFLLWMVCVFLFLMAWQWKQRISELVRSVSRGKQLQLSHYAFEPHWLLKSNKIFWVALIVVIYNKNWRILYVVHHRVEQNL